MSYLQDAVEVLINRVSILEHKSTVFVDNDKDIVSALELLDAKVTNLTMTVNILKEIINEQEAKIDHLSRKSR